MRSGPPGRSHLACILVCLLSFWGRGCSSGPSYSLGPSTGNEVSVFLCESPLCDGTHYSAWGFFDRSTSSEVRAIPPCRVQTSQNPLYANVGDVVLTAPRQSIPLPNGMSQFGRVYLLWDATGAPWNPGDLVGVTASGGDIPAFNGSVPFPGYVRLRTSLPMNGAQLDLRYDVPLALQWDSLSLGDVWVHFQVQCSGRADWQRWVECLFPGSSGSGTVPSDALSYVNEMSSCSASRLLITLRIGSFASTTIAAGRDTIRFRVSGLAFAASQELAPR